MKIYFFYFIVFLGVFSCSETNNEEIQNEKKYSSLEERLEDGCGSILELEYKFDSLFCRTGELFPNKASYANFFLKIEQSDLKNFKTKLEFVEDDSLTESDKRNLWDLTETNFLDYLFKSCREYQNSENFSEKQQEFVKEFAFDNYQGKPDLVQISKILSEMSETEFQNDGIKECCLIYIVEYFSYDIRY